MTTASPPPLTFCLPPGVCQLDATPPPATTAPHPHAPTTTYAVLSFTLTNQHLHAANTRHSHSVHSHQHADSNHTITSISWWGAERNDVLATDIPLQYTIVIPVDRFLQYLLDTPQHQLQLVVRSTHNNSVVAEGAVDLTDLIHHLGTSSVAPQYTATQTYAVTHARNRTKYGDVTIRTDFQLTSTPKLVTPARASSRASSASLNGLAERANRLKQQLQKARELEVERQRADQLSKPDVQQRPLPTLYAVSPPPHHHELHHHSQQQQSPKLQPLRMRLPVDDAHSSKQRLRSPLKPAGVALSPKPVHTPASLDTLSVICVRLRAVTYHNGSDAQQLQVTLFGDEHIAFQLPTPTSDSATVSSSECHHVYRVSNHRLVQQLATAEATAHFKHGDTPAPTTQSASIPLQSLSTLLQHQLQSPLKPEDVQRLTITQVQQRCSVQDDISVDLSDVSGLHVATCVLSLHIGSEDEITQLDGMDSAARTLQKHARKQSIARADRKASITLTTNTQSNSAVTHTPVKKLRSPKHQHKSPAASPIPATIKSPKSRAVKPVKPIAVDLLQRSSSIDPQNTTDAQHRKQQSSYIAPTVRQTTDAQRNTADTPPIVEDEPLPDFLQSSPDLLKAKKKQQLQDVVPDGSQSHRASTVKSTVSRPRTSTSVPPRRATLMSGHVRRVSIAPRSQTASRPLSSMLTSGQQSNASQHNATATEVHNAHGDRDAHSQHSHFTPAHTDDTDLTIASHFDEDGSAHHIPHVTHHATPAASSTAHSHHHAVSASTNQSVPATTSTTVAASSAPPAANATSTEAILSAISMLQATVVATMAMAYNATHQQAAMPSNTNAASTTAAHSNNAPMSIGSDASLQTPQRQPTKPSKDIATSPIDSLYSNAPPPTATNARDVYITIESAKGASIDLNICEDVLADAAKLQKEDQNIKSIRVPPAINHSSSAGIRNHQPIAQPRPAHLSAAANASHTVAHNAVDVAAPPVVPSSSSTAAAPADTIDESQIAPAHRRDDRSTSVERKDSQARVNKILSGSRLPPRPPTSNKTADYVSAAPAASYSDEIPLEDRLRRQQARRIAAGGLSSSEDPDLERMQRIARILKAKII